MTFREAIRKALADEMALDKNVVLMGEDVGVYGGCFKVTEGLFKDFPNQVIDTPVSEEAFSGMAVGAAMMGMRPVIEIMYADFFTLISDAVINHAAKTHFMSGGQFSCPLTIRLPEGSGTGHGPQHTQSPEAFFMNCSGLKIVAPSNPSDAYHLLRKSIRDNNPILFFEHKLLYGEEGEIKNSSAEIGKANVIREGNDLTIISYSHAVKTALECAELLNEKNVDASVIDLCTIKPIDYETIFNSIRKTGRAVIIQDTNTFGSVSSEIAGSVASDRETFNNLKYPVLQIGGTDTPVPFSKELEKTCIPSAQQCSELILKLFN